MRAFCESCSATLDIPSPENYRDVRSVLTLTRGVAVPRDGDPGWFIRSYDEVVLAIQKAHGCPPPPNGVAGMGAASQDGPPLELTRREQEVLGVLLAGGSDDASIARALTISRHTAKAHVLRIMARLNVRSRALLAAEAHRRGLHCGSGGAERSQWPGSDQCG